MPSTIRESHEFVSFLCHQQFTSSSFRAPIRLARIRLAVLTSPRSDSEYQIGATRFLRMCGAPKGTPAVTRAAAARAPILTVARAAACVRARSRRKGRRATPPQGCVYPLGAPPASRHRSWSFPRRYPGFFAHRAVPGSHTSTVSWGR